LFNSIDEGSSSVLSRRRNGLSNVVFDNRTGIAIPGNGTFTDVPGYTIPGTGSGSGARFNVSYSGGGYTNVVAVYAGSDYQENTQIRIDGSLLGGNSGVQDLTLVVAPANIDTATYYGFQRSSTTAETNSIVRTDINRNLGDSGNKFNSVFATNFIGTASRASNLAGDVIGSVPYQSATNTTAFIAPINGRFLKSNGLGVAPSWELIPDGSGETLSGSTLSANIVNSSLTNVGTLTGLSLSGFINYSLDVDVTATGTTQTGAQLLSKNINNIADGTGGVLLPNTTSLGHRIMIRNETFVNINVYPNLNSRINNQAINVPYVLPSSAVLEFVYLGITPGSAPDGQWATPNATLL
jgi:hypothetical protein